MVDLYFAQIENNPSFLKSEDSALEYIQNVFNKEGKDNFTYRRNLKEILEMNKTNLKRLLNYQNVEFFLWDLFNNPSDETKQEFSAKILKKYYTFLENETILNTSSDKNDRRSLEGIIQLLDLKIDSFNGEAPFQFNSFSKIDDILFY